MLGRTHMALGGIAAVAAAPLVIHTGWEPMKQLIFGNWYDIPHVLVSQSILVIATVVGSIIPDLDESHSLMAQKVEIVGRIVITALLVALVVVLHRETSISAWAYVAILGFLFGAKKTAARRAGLGILGVGFMYLGSVRQIPFLAAVLLTVWIIGAMFSKHRTFTHSLIGLALFAEGVNLSMHRLAQLHLGIAVMGLSFGYILHLVEDAVAGGVPLLWPWGQRFGIRLVKTGSLWDHMLGGLATLGFAALVIL